MSPAAIEWINTFLDITEIETGRDKLKILEFGSGVSTIILAQLRPNDEIISIEEDKEWYKRVDKWLKERKLKNVNLILEEVEERDYYKFDEMTNTNYFHVCEQFKPFDLIINDGNMREYIGDNVLEKADEFLTEGGLYLRHDYEKAWTGTWVGPHVIIPEWIKGDGNLYYDSFCATHEGYELITVSGNGTWGHRAELGGVWRN